MPLRPVIEQAVVSAFALDGRDIGGRTRGKAEIAFARQVAMYLAHVGLGLNLTDVGAVFGRDRTTVRHACRSIEDRRDEPSLDRALDLLEGIVRATARWSRLHGDSHD